jgi:hypothetical protein
MSRRCAIIIPAYNEANNIRALVGDIKKIKPTLPYPADIVIINDGSTDSTFDEASRLGCIVLDLPINLGIGGAVQTGIKYAFENGYDFAIQMDGDGQHPAEEIPKLIQAMEAQSSDIVIGSRFLENVGFQSTFLRRQGIKYFTWLIKLCCGQNITDCTSGFRLLNRRAISLVNDYYPDQYPEPESILFFAFNGLKIVETPVIMAARTGGKSSIQYLTSLYYTIKVSLAIFFTFVKLKSWKT